MLQISSKNRLTSLLLAGLTVVVCILWFVGDQIAAHNRFVLKSEIEAIETHRTLDAREEEFLVGPQDARVVVVEYSDLECPYCKLLNARMPYFQARYKEQSVAFAFRHFPLEHLHKQAPEEAIALECVGILKGPEAFFRFRDMVYANTEGNDTLDLALLPRFAEDLGITKEDFTACRESDEAKRRVNEDIMSGSVLGIYSTPSLALYKDGVFQYVIKGGSPIGWRNLETGIDSLLKK